MYVSFSEKRQKKKKKVKNGQKRAKYLKTSAKMYKIWKYLKKGQMIVCDFCTQQTARKGPASEFLRM